jgi:hypothetical protein
MTKLDYLFVSSLPRVDAMRGRRYEYAMEVHSSSGGVEYTIQAGPPDMTISADGRLTLDVPSQISTTEYPILIGLRDAGGLTSFHSYTLRILTPEPEASVPGWRMWTERSGKRQVEARLLEVVEDRIRLEARDGRQFVVPLDAFSENDRAYVADQGASGESQAAPPRDQDS